MAYSDRIQRVFRRMETRTVAALAIAALWSSQSLAQSASPLNNTELSKGNRKSDHSPDHVAVALSSRLPGWCGQAHEVDFELDQAVVPFRLNEDWSLITRTKLPAEALPPKKSDDFGR